MAMVFRISSLAAISAALLAPVITVFLMPVPELTAMVFSVSTILIWRHHKNIHNLLRGIEPRIGNR